MTPEEILAKCDAQVVIAGPMGKGVSEQPLGHVLVFFGAQVVYDYVQKVLAQPAP